MIARSGKGWLFLFVQGNGRTNKDRKSSTVTEAPVAREKLTSMFWIVDEYDTLMISIRKGELTKTFSTLVIRMCETFSKSLIEPSSS